MEIKFTSKDWNNENLINQLNEEVLDLREQLNEVDVWK